MFPMFLLDPVQQARYRQDRRDAERRRFDRNVKNAVDWDLWKTKPSRKVDVPLIIKAETYNIDHRLFDVKPTQKHADPDPKTFVEYGDWRYCHRETAPKMPLSVPLFPDRESQPEVFFTKPVVIPTLVENDGRGWRVWMSLTPAEIFSQRSGIQFCRGEVVVAGLGLGWFLSEVAKRSQVTKITVVEKDARLLDWFGNDLCKRLGVDVICGDLWNVIPLMPKTTRIAADIWPQWFEARGDSKLRDARKAGYDIWAWGSPRGGSW